MYSEWFTCKVATILVPYTCISHCMCTIVIIQAMLMDLVPSDKSKGLKTPIWDDYKKLMNDSEGTEVSPCGQ